MIVSSVSFLVVPFLFGPLASAVTHDCSHMRADGTKFDFSKIGGPHAVTNIDRNKPPSVYNITWTVDVCNPLERADDIDKADQCPQGTYVCGIVKSYNPIDDPNQEHVEIENVIPVAGSFQTTTGKGLEPHYERLKTQAESAAEGLEVQLNGGTYGKKKQQAVIRFICDKNKTGNEGASTQEKRDEGDDGQEDVVDPNNSLSFVSYGPEEGKLDMGILRLDWKTKYACEDFVEEEGDQSSSWGFFTWLILLLFLGIAAYLIFGSWLNYHRYGARGWDLLPHGDTIRDVPYLFKDWSRKVIETVSGRGSRGGYSAV